MIEIRYEKEKRRSAAYDGEVLAGECDFEEEDGVWVIVHTGVDSAYGGQGIAAMLVEELVKQARTAAKKIRPVCSYAVRQFEKIPEYGDVRA